MTTRTHISYEVGIKGGHGCFSPDGRKTSWTKTYGFEDVVNHIAELREHVYEGKKPYANSQFVIRTVTTVTTEIDYKENN